MLVNFDALNAGGLFVFILYEAEVVAEVSIAAIRLLWFNATTPVTAAIFYLSVIINVAIVRFCKPTDEFKVDVSEPKYYFLNMFILYHISASYHAYRNAHWLVVNVVKRLVRFRQRPFSNGIFQTDKLRENELRLRPFSVSATHSWGFVRKKKDEHTYLTQTVLFP